MLHLTDGLHDWLPRGKTRAMQTFDELERLWQASPPAPRGRGTVELICVRKGKGVHDCPEVVRLSTDVGVEGDRWSKGLLPDRQAQVTLMASRVAELVAGEHAPLHLSGDNFFVDFEMGEQALPAGTRLRIGSALLEVSPKPHTGCKKFRERFGVDALRWVNHKDFRPRRLRGVNCRVLAPGEVRVGDVIEVVA